MKFLRVLALFLICSTALAGNTRIIEVDSFRTPDRTKTWSLPSTSGAIPTLDSTDEFENKSIDGTKNTITNVSATLTFVQVVPTGLINGSNASYTIPDTPTSAAAVRIYKNGIYLFQGAGNDYTISGSTITMAVAPALGSSLHAVYTK